MSFSTDAFSTSFGEGFDKVAPAAALPLVFKGGFGDNAFGGIALSSESTGAVFAAASITLGGLTAVSTGAVDISADASNTLDALSLTSAAAVDIQGDLTATLGALSLTSATVIALGGDASVTLGVVTLSADGSITLVADAAITLSAITLSSDGEGVDRNLNLTATLSDLLLTSIIESRTGDGGMYRPTVPNVNDPDSGGGFYNDDADIEGGDTGFWNAHSKDSGSGGGF